MNLKKNISFSTQSSVIKAQEKRRRKHFQDVGELVGTDKKSAIGENSAAVSERGVTGGNASGMV